MKFTKLSELEDKYIGKVGTPRRDQYEYELKLDLLGEMIKKARKEQSLTQSELGERMGVKKAQVSKIENASKDAKISTILRAFHALDAQVHFKVEIMGQELRLA